MEIDISQQLKIAIDNKTKPLGALGVLEIIATQIGTLQNTINPTLNNPHIVVFAADHGIAIEGVSAYPAEVTQQMVLNFLNGGSAINVFCKQNNIQLKIVDAGVKFEFSPHENLIISKPKNGTANILNQPAMTKDELDFSLESGKKIVQTIYQKNCNVIGFGEMGIGNTSSASLITATILNISVETCTGKGTGLTDEKLKSKIEILQKGQEKHQSKTKTTEDILMSYGGFEIAQITGAILEAHRLGMLILIDGFIVTSALLVAHQFDNAVLENCIFCTQSQEQGHQKALDYLGVPPVLQLGLRLGEGTGCALAFPIIQSAVNFLNEMASFDEANVSK
ncbi:MAG: nicotinate-nucleotide--dimethylbenzimidazole phosphoribosyltransferase [Sphingobacteriales bacterium]|jgi:nicotinate-nucleotide--dimethylbenzimidazole phosphoribosyltransferase|nr:nicotinate-nucleotide--dimethylbenzimidazole phosphoribosyltransferase [Sphingobacteriales bacterium]